MLIIGITGGTGGGKTTFLKALDAYGACTIDCDALYHELLTKSKDMLKELEDEFGGVIKDGKLDRKALGSIVFGDDKKLLRLNAITHKYVGAEVRKRLSEAEKAGKKIAAVDAIALIESRLKDMCDIVVGIIAKPETRISRIMAREGISREYAKKRIEAQKQDDFFKDNCDYILENNYENEAEFLIKCRELIDIIIEKSGKNEHI